METTWSVLSRINVNDKVNKKGKFDYLSWTWAIDAVKRQNMHLDWQLLDDVHYPDGTMEVRCNVIIGEQSHTMWLAVCDHNNKAIPNPNAAAINKARMRCLVKGIAAHGLGFYIYAGEDLPEPPDTYALIAEQIETAPETAVEMFMSLPQEAQVTVANSAPHGKKVEFKKRLAALEAQKHAFCDQVAADIEQIYSDWKSDQRGGGPDVEGINQITSELTNLERKLVGARLGSETLNMVRNATTEAA